MKRKPLTRAELLASIATLSGAHTRCVVALRAIASATDTKVPGRAASNALARCGLLARNALSAAGLSPVPMHVAGMERDALDAVRKAALVRQQFEHSFGKGVKP